MIYWSDRTRQERLHVICIHTTASGPHYTVVLVVMAAVVVVDNGQAQKLSVCLSRSAHSTAIRFLLLAATAVAVAAASVSGN